MARTLRVEPGSAPRLAERTTTPVSRIAKPEAKKLLAEQTAELSALQEQLYARGTHAVLVVFQAMDAAGKDSTINHVFSGVNPQGVRVASFKAPNDEALAHDFLWRINEQLPPRGHIGVFNRSHYEETVVVRVHPHFLDAQRLPPRAGGLDALWQERYEDINAFERHLDRNGTKVVKFFLHVSAQEQRDRLLARIAEPEKHWKFNADDLSERKRRADYLAAYEDTIAATSTEWAPWHVVPAAHKPTMRVLVSRVLLDTLRDLDLAPPTPSAEQRRELDDARAQLEAER